MHRSLSAWLVQNNQFKTTLMQGTHLTLMRKLLRLAKDVRMMGIDPKIH